MAFPQHAIYLHQRASTQPSCVYRYPHQSAICQCTMVSNGGKLEESISYSTGFFRNTTKIHPRRKPRLSNRDIIFSYAVARRKRKPLNMK